MDSAVSPSLFTLDMKTKKNLLFMSGRVKVLSIFFNFVVGQIEQDKQ